MAVTGSALAAGHPPYMPVYVNWADCWSHLARNNQLGRGQGFSIIESYYPVITITINRARPRA